MSSGDPVALLREVLLFVEERHKDLLEGKDITLSGLENKIAELCKIIEQLPSEEGKTYRDHLQLLFNEISDLGDVLKEEHSLLRAEIDGLNVQKKAHIAYKVSDSMDSKKDNDEESE